jgi:SPP1 family predicted phage head-tail adaptor
MPLQGVVQQGRTQVLIARFRHRIKIVQPSSTQDSTGGWNVSANNVVYSTWASVEALSATEKFAAHEFASVVTHSVWIRHPRNMIDPTGNTSGITAAMQVWFGTRQFQIMGVLNPDERKDILRLMCSEIDDSKNQTSTLSEAQS